MKPIQVLALLSLASSLALPQAPVAAPPEFRLGDAVRPVRYSAELTVVPADDTFTGIVEIDLEIRQPTPVVWLNATELSVREAKVDAGGRSIPARPVPGGSDFLGFAFERAVGPGKASLHVVYEGKIAKKSPNGLFAVKEGDDWYAYTQFEAIDARRAFPCFDEPAFKIPWQLTLRVKKEHMAVANTRVVSETETRDGMKAVRFAETRPLPSYLVAMAVGPFEGVEAGRAGKNNTPLRIITPRGKTAQARFAVQATAPILSLLEDYSGIPYPYEKLDSIAVPLFPGAMENPGLVTYNQTMLLSRPEDETLNFQRTYASVCAHELAHMWFGDLVTMAWWDDVWLNEAFASWMGTKIIERWKPEWKALLSGVGYTQGAMSEDSLTSARKIRQPVLSKHDIANAFDTITYSKGAAVLAMFENWTGAETFRKGVRRYLDKHAWGNATAADFLSALSAAAGRDIAPAFWSFLDQAGAPLVTVDLACSAGAPPRLELAQRRLLPLGSKGSSEQTWQIPVCIKAAGSERQCTLLTQARAEVPLSSSRCPEWVLANAEQAGYYRVLYRGDLTNRLVRDGDLSGAERVGLLGDARALMRSGDLSAAQALSLVRRFSSDPERHVVMETIVIADSVRQQLVPERLRSNYARFICGTYGERARALGWKPRPGEDEETGLLRPMLVGLIAAECGDKALIDEARSLAGRWLEDRRVVDPNVVDVVLRVAARYGDRALFERFRSAAKQARDRRDRARLLSAMGSFRDPGIVQSALALVLSDEFDPRETVRLLFAPLRDPETRALPFEFVKQNYDAIVARVPGGLVGDLAARLPEVCEAFCDEQRRAEVEAFFKDRAAKATGGPRILAQVLEQISLCSALRDAQQASVAEFLEKY